MSIRIAVRTFVMFGFVYFVQEVSEPAAEALVNLSQVPDLAGKMVEMSIVKIVMDILYKIDCDIKHLLVMLIVNITQLDAGIESLIQVALIIYL